ncbi:4-diphosphocytidyl-2-C-methyl-D-erythritol kinase [Desulfatibacillum alkenivorans DSM 16219]|uniref:4-diphosphocytidyl-2-C-methyl-D-erythritol kinase n=1 Tax=Desulfatibacillum alkenivorans DSM 16219 TaxID=1121393 RepID=A0A1M6ULS1_9BACT|nr:4-(cytidine 5'-diphospho)-2-C-methyl-D-erythritol kinase [Desulfatibacillum alkenivorans]SHK70080.1 4-diphosphocytidyl-2-C-methyl-D-erythritol kinase [Desulfatibacillum alkenivorans DSM 16219]
MPHRLEIASPAKVNLTLRICGRRDDGFHEIESLMAPISLSDRVILEAGGSGIRIRCDAPGIPEDEANLAWRAADLFFKESGSGPGLSITLEKNIPAGAGLGGGSGNAASVLNGLNTLLGRPFSLEKLADMGARIGSDVPFFVYGKPAWITSVGEAIDLVRGLYPHHLVVVFPGIEASTAKVYKKCNLALTRCKKIHRVPDLTGDPAYVEGLLCNDLERPALEEYPGIGKAKDALSQTQALGVLMSGSGSSVFGLFRQEAEAVETRRTLESKHPGWRVFSCRLLV